jgi:hypothetical protein
MYINFYSVYLNSQNCFFNQNYAGYSGALLVA